MKKIYIVRVLEANKTWDDRSNIKKKLKKTNRVFNNFAGITTFILKQDKSTSL